MKSILYFGAALMVGASIYGFIDYKKTSRNGDLDRMYKAEEVSQAVVIEEETAPVVVEKAIAATEEQKFAIIPEKVVPKKTAVKKKTVVILRQAQEAVEKLETKPAIVNTRSLKENKSITPFKRVKKRRLDSELFSRARPRSVEIVEIKLPEPVKEQ